MRLSTLKFETKPQKRFRMGIIWVGILSVQKSCFTAGLESFVRGGPTLTGFCYCFFFLFFSFFMRGERIQIALKVGHHQPASKMPFK